MWSSGQTWRVVNSLNKLREQIEAYAPRAKPPSTDVTAWGAIADDEHSSSSDHYPHFYSSLGNTAVVCARDFPHAPQLGLDGHVVTEALRISRDPRIGYIICDGRITGPNHSWRWDDYDGSDPHDTHFHVSTVHDGRADSTAPWSLPGPAIATPRPVEDDDMPTFTINTGGGSDNATSLCIGIGTKRRLVLCNETFGKAYALRVWISNGAAFSPAPATTVDGYVQLNGGARWAVDIADDICLVSIVRMGRDTSKPSGQEVVPASETFPAYAGHLTCAIERS